MEIYAVILIFLMLFFLACEKLLQGLARADARDHADLLRRLRSGGARPPSIARARARRLRRRSVEVRRQSGEAPRDERKAL